MTVKKNDLATVFSHHTDIQVQFPFQAEISFINQRVQKERTTRTCKLSSSMADLWRSRVGPWPLPHFNYNIDSSSANRYHLVLVCRSAEHGEYW